LEELGVDWKIVLKPILKMGLEGMGLSGCCETSDYIKFCVYLDYMSGD
jgi:hypothetical protein